jgi:hypothetical protein
MDKKNIFKTVVLAYVALFLSACASFSEPARSLPELMSRAPNDPHGAKKIITLRENYVAVSKKLATHLSECYNFSSTLTQNGRRSLKKEVVPSYKKMGKGKDRFYISVKDTDYGIFSDDVKNAFPLLFDVEYVSNNKTRVTSYRINDSKSAEGILATLQGKEDTYCPGGDDD